MILLCFTVEKLQLCHFRWHMSEQRFGILMSVAVSCRLAFLSLPCKPCSRSPLTLNVKQTVIIGLHCSYPPNIYRMYEGSRGCVLGILQCQQSSSVDRAFGECALHQHFIVILRTGTHRKRLNIVLCLHPFTKCLPFPSSNLHTQHGLTFTSNHLGRGECERWNSSKGTRQALVQLSMLGASQARRQTRMRCSRQPPRVFLPRHPSIHPSVVATPTSLSSMATTCSSMSNSSRLFHGARTCGFGCGS